MTQLWQFFGRRRSAEVPAAGDRGPQRRVGRGRGPLACSTPSRRRGGRRRPGAGHRAALAAGGSRRCRGGDVPGPAFHTARGRATPSSPAAGSRSSAPARARSRSCRGSRTRPSRSPSSSGRRPGRCPKPDRGYGPLRPGAAPAVPGADAARPAGSGRSPCSPGWRSPATGSPGRRCGRRRGLSCGAGARPRAAARLTPDYPMGCKRVLFTGDWLPTLAPARRPAGDRAGRGGAAADGVRSADGEEHPCDVSSTAPASPPPVPRADPGARRAAAPRSPTRGADGAHAYLGMTVPGFPNLFLIYGPEHQHRQHLGAVLRGGAGPVRRPGGGRDRAAAGRSTCADDVASTYDAEIQRRLARQRVDGVPSWYRTADRPRGDELARPGGRVRQAHEAPEAHGLRLAGPAEARCRPRSRAVRPGHR